MSKLWLWGAALVLLSQLWCAAALGRLAAPLRVRPARPAAPALQSKTADAAIYDLGVRAPHPKTVSTALRHCEHFGLYASRNVIAQHTRLAFEEATRWVDAFYSSQGQAAGPVQSVILDSGCGQGLSTMLLARASPTVPVIGIDRSVSRLSRNVLETKSSSSSSSSSTQEEQEADDDDENDDAPSSPPSGSFFVRSYPNEQPNVLFVRAEISDFWLLVANSSTWRVQAHNILYPNPYPKAKHLARRWHGHPVFPLLLVLGGNLRLRSNWDVYVAEMQQSLEASAPVYFSDTHPLESTPLSAGPFTLAPGVDRPLTHFERKYHAVGLALYELRFAMRSLDLEERREVLARLSRSPAPPSPTQV